MFKKINIFSFLGALVLFAMPWFMVQCNGRTLATQSGIQSIYGGASLDDSLKGLANDKSTSSENQTKPKDKPGIAFLSAIALLLVIAALGISIHNLKKPNAQNALPACYGAAAALALLLQVAVGSPIEREMAESMENKAKTKEDNAMAAAVVGISVKYAPCFYLELLALAIPVGFLVNQTINKKTEESGE